jgi:hypothetical protein
MGTFTLDLVNQTMTIDLLNLELNPQYDFQILGSVQITLSNLNGSATAPTVQSSSFTAMNVASSTPTALGSQPANKWAFPTIAGGAYAVGPNILEFCVDCISTLGSKQLIIGGPNPVTGLYDAAGSGITSAGHQPYILGSGGTYSSGPLSGPTFSGLKSSPEWVLKVPQLTATSAVTGVTFGFGTAYASSQFVTGQDPAPVPEPGVGSLVFTGCFLIGVSAFLRQRRPSPVNQPLSPPPGRAQTGQPIQG